MDPTDLKLVRLATHLMLTLSAHAKQVEAAKAQTQVINAQNIAVNQAIDLDGQQGTTESCKRSTAEDDSVEMALAYDCRAAGPLVPAIRRTSGSR